MDADKLSAMCRARRRMVLGLRDALASRV